MNNNNYEFIIDDDYDFVKDLKVSFIKKEDGSKLFVVSGFNKFSDISLISVEIYNSDGVKCDFIKMISVDGDFNILAKYKLLEAGKVIDED